MKKSRFSTLFLFCFWKVRKCSGTFIDEKVFVQTVKKNVKKLSKHFVKKTEKGLLFFLFLVIINSRVGSGYKNRYFSVHLFRGKASF